MLQKLRSFIYGTHAYMPPKQGPEEKLQEILAAHQVFSILSGASYVPFSRASLNFSSLAVLMNDIVVNDRKLIVEFGAGISTYAIARLIQKNNLSSVHLLSVDNDSKWLNIVEGLLEKEGLMDHIQLLHAPLRVSDLALDNNQWYDADKISSALNGYKKKVDCVLVDGPAAWYKGTGRSRFPAMPFIMPWLADTAAVFLDDTNRAGEKKVLKLWSGYGFTKERFSRSFTGLFRGANFQITLP